MPGSLRLTYNLACAEALTGDLASAAKHLETVLDRRLDLGIEEDEDLAALRTSPEYAPVARKLAVLHAPVSKSVVAFRLPERDLVTEGLAFDAKSRAFFVSSVHHRKIVRRAADGKLSDFVPEGRDGLEGVLALRIDAKRGILWACSAALPEMIGYDKSQDGSSALFGFDLATGRLVRRAALPKTGRQALNDLAIASNGDVYATDSLAGGVYRLPAGATALETVTAPGVFRSPQGIALARGEKQAYVAEYGAGIFRVDLATGAREALASPPDLPLEGVDGLVLRGDELVVTQNGIRPIRVTRLRLDSDGRRVTGGEVLEMNTAQLEEPTLGVLVGDDFYYVGNAQWGSFDKEGKMLPLEKLHEPQILRVSLR